MTTFSTRWFFDPTHCSGCPGLTAVLRAGNAVIANAIGTGIADDKAVFAYTPAMIRYYLGEEPIIPIVETHLLRDPEVCEFVLRNLDRYVIKPTGASGGYGVVIGPKADGLELAETRARILRDPAAFIAQPVVQLSVHPTLAGGADATLAARARRSAPVRSARRKTARAARRTYARRAARRLADRQLLAGRWQQGHLGARKLVLRRIADHLYWAARYLERAQWRVAPG